MGNNKGSGIFLGVIGVATLIVAIIGATFAFFGANAGSEEGAVTVTSTVLSLGYADVKTGLKTNLIPAEDYIAEYSATNTGHMADKGECKDDYGNEICGVYTFTIGNPSFTTSQDLYGTIQIVSNDFTDLYFRIYDEEGEEVVAPTAFTTAQADADGKMVIELEGLNQKLIPSTEDKTFTPEKDGDKFTSADPTTFTKVTDDAGNSNVRTYKMLIWIRETHSDQTELNSGKTLVASVNFTTASGTSGVTGVIMAAQNPDEVEGD